MRSLKRSTLLSFVLLHIYLVHINDARHHNRRKEKSTRLESCFREFDKKFEREWFADRRASGGSLSNLNYLNLLHGITGQSDGDLAGQYDILRYLIPQLLKGRNGSGLSPKEKLRLKRKRKRKRSKKKIRDFWERAVFKGAIG